MDMEGYVPASLVFNFPGVACWNLPYRDLIYAVAEKSSKLEVDTYNETLRIKDDFAKWLFPNIEGGFGCPKWYKMEFPQVVEVTTTEEESNKLSVAVADEKKPSLEETAESSSSSETVPDLAACSGSDSVSTDANDATSSDESAGGAFAKQ